MGYLAYRERMTHHTLADLQAAYPDWVIWQGIRSDAGPGDYYANRRRWSADLPAEASLTVVGTTLDELEVELKEQQRIEEKANR